MEFFSKTFIKKDGRACSFCSPSCSPKMDFWGIRFYLIFLRVIELVNNHFYPILINRVLFFGILVVDECDKIVGFTVNSGFIPMATPIIISGRNEYG